MKNKIGKAYAFFDCDASKEDIEKELPTIREAVKTPNELELSLTEGFDNVPSLTEDKQLLQITKQAKDAKLRYFMEATLPNETNKRTADELSAVLNQAYQSSLYKKREKFIGEIVYEELGWYVFRK